MIGQTVSHYRILDKLGEGGMGTVYLAEDTLLGRRVAIKTLALRLNGQQYRTRFLREAQSVSALSHPNIATVYDYGEAPDGTPFIVMELIRGQTLGDLIDSKALTLVRTIEIVEKIAEALAEAHRHGIAHRDIKPTNIAISDRGEVKVLDFGLAKQLSETSASGDSDKRALPPTKTREGIILGTPRYLSPEQALGLAIDVRSDIFSLGSLLYECLSGRPAFPGTSDIDVCAKVIRDDPPPPSRFNPRVPTLLDRITLKALAKKPEDRYQSADELRVDLRAVHVAITGRSRVEYNHPPLLSDAPRRNVQWTFPRVNWSGRYVTAAVLIAVAAGFAIWVNTRSRDAGPRRPPPRAANLYREGTNALHNNAYYQAKDALESAVKVDDRFPLAYARLAETWAELDYEDKAKDALSRANILALADHSELSPVDILSLHAINAVLIRDLGGAVEQYREILRRVPDTEKVTALLDLGRAYEKNEALEAAVESYSEAISNNPQHATAFLRLGVLYGRQQRFEDATQAFARAKELYQADRNQEGVAEVHYQRGYFLNNVDRLAEAREELELALELTRQTGNKPQQVKLMLQLSSVFYTEGKTTVAEQYATDALDLARAEGLESLTTSGLIDLGWVFVLFGKYEEAEKYFMQAMEVASRFKGRRGEARAQLSLGSLRMQQSKTDSALNYIQKALTFYQQGKYRKETSQALLLLGRAYDYKGNYDEAIRALEQQILLAKEIGDHSQVARAHMEIGSSLAHQERYVEALSHFDECYRLDTSLNNQALIGYDLLNRGIVLLQLGRYAEARQAFTGASRLAGQPGGGNKQLAAWLHLSTARLALSERNFPEAIERGKQAYGLAGTQFRDIAAQAKYTLGLAQALSGTPARGVTACNEAVELAKLTGDPRLVSYARLALAEALIESRDASGALENALAARESFERSGQKDSAWRASVIAAQASYLAGDMPTAESYASRASELLSNIQQQWGEEAFKLFLSKPDSQNYQRRLDVVVASTRPVRR